MVCPPHSGIVDPPHVCASPALSPTIHVVRHCRTGAPVEHWTSASQQSVDVAWAHQHPQRTCSVCGCVRLMCARHMGWIGWELCGASALIVNLGFPIRAGLVIAVWHSRWPVDSTAWATLQWRCCIEVS